MANYLTSNPIILNEARDYLNGLILGDGNINSSNITGYYRQGCKYKGWLDKISEDLCGYKIECRIDDGQLQFGGFNSKDGSVTYNLWTRSYSEFKKIHDYFYIKWYDIDNYTKHYWHLDKESGEYFVWKKIVPKDICLSPVCLANWYLGDGGAYKSKYRNSYHIHISTEGFLRDDTVFLADLLCETLDINCGVARCGVIQICTQADVSKFLNYIKDYKVDCYAYKFPDKFINNIKENIL